MREIFDGIRVRAGCDTEFVRQVLEWRGFLVSTHGPDLVLSPESSGGHRPMGSGWETDDVESLAHFGFRLEPNLDSTGWIISWAPAKLADRLWQLFSFYIEHPGMSASSDFLLEPFWKAVMEFQHYEHLEPEEQLRQFREWPRPRRVPALVLDPGIALVVKALPVLGLETQFSCSGHGHKGAYVEFASRYHLRWWRTLFTTKNFPGSEPLQRLSTFSTTRWNIQTLAYQANYIEDPIAAARKAFLRMLDGEGQLEPVDLVAFWGEIHRLAVQILNFPAREKVCSMKAGAIDENSFDRICGSLRNSVEE